MSQGRGVREVVDEIRGALNGRSPEALLEILTYVFKEYVVEGRGLAPKSTHVLAAKSELEGMSFVEVVRWMQLHLDVPELAQFEISGSRVSLKSGNQLIPIESAASRAEPLPAAPPVIAPSPVAAPIAAPVAAPAPSRAAPPPSAVAATPRPAQPAAAPAQAVPATPPAQAPASTDKPAAEDNAKRFSLLEVD